MRRRKKPGTLQTVCSFAPLVLFMIALALYSIMPSKHDHADEQGHGGFGQTLDDYYKRNK